MKTIEELVKDEIQLADDECCIVFDFGCYFPYSNFEVLNFNFTLGMETIDDCKINHRYPNKSYQTISKKYGRKISKIGYPYIMKLKEQSPMLLCLKVGINEECLTLVFPIQTNMTKDEPICGLSLHYFFDKSEFYFMSYEKAKDCGGYQHIWRNYESKDKINNDNEILLNNPHRAGDSYTLIYDNVIEPYPQALSDFML